MVCSSADNSNIDSVTLIPPCKAINDINAVSRIQVVNSSFSVDLPNLWRSLLAFNSGKSVSVASMSSMTPTTWSVANSTCSALANVVVQPRQHVRHCDRGVVCKVGSRQVMVSGSSESLRGRTPPLVVMLQSHHCTAHPMVLWCDGDTMPVFGGR